MNYCTNISTGISLFVFGQNLCRSIKSFQKRQFQQSKSHIQYVQPHNLFHGKMFKCGWNYCRSRKIIYLKVNLNKSKRPIQYLLLHKNIHIGKTFRTEWIKSTQHINKWSIFREKIFTLDNKNCYTCRQSKKILSPYQTT